MGLGKRIFGTGPLPDPGDTRGRDTLLTVAACLAFSGLLWLVENHASGYVVHMLTLSGLFVVLAVSYNLINGVTGQLSLEPNAFVACGAYVTALLTISPMEKEATFILEPLIWPLSVISIPLLPALLIAGLCTAFMAFVMGFPVFRVRGDYLAIVTLGFGEIVRIILNNWMTLTNGPNGLLGIKAPSLLVPSFEGGFSFELLYLKKLHYLYYIALALAIVTTISVRNLNYSRIGRAWESIREDETAAELMGVNTFLLKLLAYAMGALFAGLAGAFFCARMRFVSPESFTFIESAMVLSMVVLGGMGSIPGIMLGAAALIVLPEVFREFETYRMLVFGMAMVVMMLFRPAGLIPAKRMGTRSDDREG